VLRALSWARVVWDLGEPPADLVRNERPVGRAVVEKVARHLAESFPAAAIAVMACCWVWAGRIMRLPPEQRVLRGTAVAP